MATILNRTQTFATNGTVTAAGLHNLIDDTGIYAGLITTQTELTTVGTADQLLIAVGGVSDTGAPRRATVQNLFDDALSVGTYTGLNLSGALTYGTATGNRTVSTSATITTGTIPNLTAGTTTSTAATITSGTVTNLASTTGTIATLNSTTGTIATLNSTTGTIVTLNSTTGTIGTLNNTTGTIATLNSTTGTIGNFSTTLIGDFTITQGTGTIGTASITPAKLSQPMTLMSGQVASTPILFSGIPSWAKRVTVILYDVGTSGNVAHINVQIGDSGGLRTTNYVSTGITVDSGGNTAGVSATDGFIWANFDSTNRNSGTMQLTHAGLNVWVANHTGRQSVGNSVFGGGTITTALNGTLDRVQIAATGLNAGSVNVLYEG